MEGNMKEISRMVKKTERVHLNGPMETNILEVGKKENSME